MKHVRRIYADAAGEQTEEPLRRIGEILVDEKMVHPHVVGAMLPFDGTVTGDTRRTRSYQN